jgi:hypothetical protein
MACGAGLSATWAEVGTLGSQHTRAASNIGLTLRAAENGPCRPTCGWAVFVSIWVGGRPFARLSPGSRGVVNPVNER